MNKTNDADRAPVRAVVMPFRIWGAGVYSKRQPRYRTAKEARDDLESYARSQGQSPLLFTVYEDLPDGRWKLA
jgi:hypothetical protein